MCSFQAVVANSASGGEADVEERGPALEFVMIVAVKEVRSPNGDAGRGSFDGGESGVIVDDVVGEEDFLAAAAAHVESGEVVEGARGADAGEEPVVFFVPEAV